MATYFSMTMVVLVAVFGGSRAGIVAPVVAPAPLVAAAAPVFGYAKAVPQNVPPHASRIDISTRALASPYIAAAPYVAAPLAYAPAAAPYIAAPAAAAPYIAAPGAPLAYGAYASPAGLVAAPAPAILG